MTPESMDNVFRALANRARRKLLDLIKEHPGCSVSDLCAAFDVSRIAVTKHLRILEESQLIVLRKNGRRREIYFNVVPIQMIYDRWTSEYSAFWAAKALDLKFFIEGDMSKSKISEEVKDTTQRSKTNQVKKISCSMNAERRKKESRKP